MNHSLQIGTLKLQSEFILAPLEGVSDCAFRKLCHRLGAGFTWTEMVRASGVVRRNAATLDLIDTYDPTTPTGLQLFAVNERELEIALNTVEELSNTTHPHFHNITAVDLNFGCPSPNIIRIGAGPALLKRGTKMTAMLRTLRDWKERTTLPIGAVGLKIRLGLSEQEIKHGVSLRVTDIANEYADYITVHARHARQRSSNPANWKELSRIVTQAKIPVIGNGDALDTNRARRMELETGCAGVMLARGAIVNPWVFRALLGEGEDRPTKKEIEEASRAYHEDAQRFSAKPKYLAFHEENFRRLLTGTAFKGAPENSHLK